MSETSDFDVLRERRRRYVESARENDFEEGLKSLLSELYPDNAHFIYELLQNAEDARARTVEFILSADSLTVKHDGERAFSIADIDSITGIGNSTKKDDPTQIGKFGVGFKAVFAYTTRPEIRSGEYSFAIADLFVPEKIEDTASESSTRFTFPFDRPGKPATTAREEVERALSQLDEKTLLFLNHISTITYVLPDGQLGFVERENVDDRHIRIKKLEADDFVTSEWLRLTGPASATSVASAGLTVAAAFRLARAEALERPRGKEPASVAATKATIEPVDNGDVSIYFPAVKETSGLRFHIHGPFASTVARDSVRDDPANVQLVDDIARLVVAALPELCAQGYIDDSFLATLPNQDDSIQQPYSRIRDAITEAFNILAITPVWGRGGGYAAAQDLVSSPTEFRGLLDSDDLPALFSIAESDDLRVFLSIAEEENEGKPQWIRERDGRAGRFLSGLNTLVFGWDELRLCLESVCDADSSYHSDSRLVQQWMTWLKLKSDDQILKVYELVGRGCENGRFRGVDLKAVPMVRLRRRGNTEHVKGTETYLPASRNESVRSRVPVDLAYFDDDEQEDQARVRYLRQFYSSAGVRRWDETAKVEGSLATYNDTNLDLSDPAALSRHLDDVKSFVRFGLANPSKARQMFSTVRFLQALQSQGSPRWVNPRETFLDLPFRNTGLTALYPRVPLIWTNGGEFAYDRAPYPLAALYLDVENIEDFLASVGARVGVEIVKVSVTHNSRLDQSWRSANRENSKGQQVDWSIDRLSDLICTGDPDLLRSLWDTVAAANASRALATYQANGSSPVYHMESQLAQILKSSRWVLDRNGDLRKPREVTLDELPSSWEALAPHSLIHKLDFGADAARSRQKRDGMSSYLQEQGLPEDSFEILREMKAEGVSLRELWASALAAKEQSLPFPEGASEDPNRRANFAAADALDAPQYETALRERSVVDGQGQTSRETKAFLRGQYTDSAGRMFCQVCQQPMPFRTQNEQWYFEAVSLISARQQTHIANALALCPLCAALYKHARSTPNDVLLAQIADLHIAEGQADVELSVVLDGKQRDIRFTGKHAIDVQAALKVAGEERDRVFLEGSDIDVL
jgi:hypothetical protein